MNTEQQQQHLQQQYRMDASKEQQVQALLERYYYQGWNKSNETIMTQVLDPNVQFRGTFRRKPLRGTANFLNYMHQSHRALANNTIEIQDVCISSTSNMTEGGHYKAAVRLLNHGVHRGDFFGIPGSGHEVSWASAAFFTLHSETLQIIDIWVVGDIDGLKHQIGAPVEAIAFET